MTENYVPWLRLMFENCVDQLQQRNRVTIVVAMEPNNIWKERGHLLSLSFLFDYKYMKPYRVDIGKTIQGNILKIIEYKTRYMKTENTKKKTKEVGD